VLLLLSLIPLVDDETEARRVDLVESTGTILGDLLLSLMNGAGFWVHSFALARLPALVAGIDDDDEDDDEQDDAAAAAAGAAALAFKRKIQNWVARKQRFASHSRRRQ
jgi:hypothetical protein